MPEVAVDQCIVNVGGRGGRRGSGVARWQAARSCCASAASGVPLRRRFGGAPWPPGAAARPRRWAR
eukprot:7280487-Lingulodinium_polyedra.AAC.1